MKKLLCLLIMSTIVTNVFAAVSSGRASGFGSSRSLVSNSSGSASSWSSRQSSNTSNRNSGSGSSFFSKPSGNISSKPNIPSKPAEPSKLYTTFKAKNAPTSTPSKRVIASDINKIFDRKYQQERKQSYYSGYRRPVVYQTIVQQHPNYGVWEAVMLWSILDDVGDRTMYYHHRDEPSFREWRADADRLCRDGIKEVCDKIQSLDRDVAAEQAKGTKVNPAYITEGVDPNIYTSTNQINVNDLSEVKICSGTASSDYSRFSSQIAAITKLKVRNVITNGSIDNLMKLASGECDLAWTQPDAKVSDELVTILETTKKEAALLICNSDIKSSDKLTSNNTIFVGSDQTGSKFTLSKFVDSLDGFKNAVINSDKTTIEASTIISKTPGACLFTVDTWDAPFVTNLDKEGKAKLIPINAKLNGYDDVYVDKNHYKNLNLSENSGTFDIGTDTLAMSPILVTTKSFIERNSTVFYDVLMLNKDALAESMK